MCAIAADSDTMDPTQSSFAKSSPKASIEEIDWILEVKLVEQRLTMA
jgi:hypothetical protein